MDTSHLLARLFGIMFVILYGSVLLNHKYFKTLWQDVIKHPFFILLTGFINLLLGLLVIEFHHLWIANWRVLITLLGWLLIVSGIWRILFPETITKFSQKMLEHNFAFVQKISIFLFLLGLYLTFMGFYG